MAIQERLYTVDDVRRLAQLPENEDKHLYLIDGELFWEMAPGYRHGRLAGHIFRFLMNYAEAHDLGDGSVESGYYPADDRHTLLGPDVAFLRKEKRPAGRSREVRCAHARPGGGDPIPRQHAC